MNFLQAMRKLIQEEIPNATVYEILSQDSQHLFVEINLPKDNPKRRYVFFVHDDATHFGLNFKPGILYDIANPEFNPEIIVDFIKKHVPGWSK